MPLYILGLNHNTAPVEIREQVVFEGDAVDRALAAVTDLDGVAEAVVLSTCNRTEFYLDCDEPGAANMRSWLERDQRMNAATAQSLFLIQREDAIRHLFRVACGLDSMVLGEPQILGQLKDAFRQAEIQGSVGPNLNRLFHHTYSVAKKVRTDTEIGASPVSVAYAAVNLANQFFAGFSQHTALLIGAGVTIELVAKHLFAKDIGRLFIANRSLERAQQLASGFDGFALPLSELAGTLPEADILISSTASAEPVLTFEQMRAAIGQRRRKPVFAVDIAVPRDLDPKISELDDVYLYGVDDLQQVILEGQSSREAAAVDANRILDDETSRYLSIERSKQVAPIITALRDHGDLLRDQVLDQARRRLARGADQEEVMEYVTSALMKKLLHQPSVRLREAGEQSDKEFVRMVSELFGLNGDKEK
ncbi:MAG: glutamyl-tRNA reductase [Gammaproteobacteria bacterium]|nr:glutamyl-tRNA reductase [Gammaproteobacteria bacterium]